MGRDELGTPFQWIAHHDVIYLVVSTLLETYYQSNWKSFRPCRGENKRYLKPPSYCPAPGNLECPNHTIQKWTPQQNGISVSYGDPHLCGILLEHKYIFSICFYAIDHCKRRFLLDAVIFRFQPLNFGGVTVIIYKPKVHPGT